MAYTVNGSVPEGAWKRVCFSYDGTNVYSRVAGSAAASFPRANVNDLAKIFKIGGWYLSPGLSNTDSCYQGDVAEMIFYNQYHAPTAQDFVFGYQQIYFGI